MRRFPMARRFWLGLVVLMVTGCLASALSITILAFGWAEDMMVQVVARTASAVGQSVKVDLEHALSLGIPLDKMEGMTEYVERLLQNNPGIHDIAIAGPDGSRLFRRDMPMAEAEFIDAGGYSTSVIPLTQGGLVQGFVRVAVQREAVLDHFLHSGWPLLLGWIVILIIAYEMATFLSEAFHAHPLAALYRRMMAAKRGDFSRLLVRRPRDEVGLCMTAFNAVIMRLHDGIEYFRIQADEAREAAFDADLARRVTALRQDILTRLDEPDMPPVPMADLRSSDMAPFLVLLAAAVAVAVSGTAGAGGPAALDLRTVMALAVAMLGLLGGLLICRRPSDLNRVRRQAGAAVLLAFTGALLQTFAAGWLLAAAVTVLLAGLALGCGLAAARQYMHLAGVTAPLARIMRRLASGTVAGGVTAYLLAVGTRPVSDSAVAAVLAVLAGFSAAMLMVRPGDGGTVEVDVAGPGGNSRNGGEE